MSSVKNAILLFVLILAVLPQIGLGQSTPTLEPYKVKGNQTIAPLSIFQNTSTTDGASIQIGGGYPPMYGSIFYKSWLPSSNPSLNYSHVFQVGDVTGNAYNVGIISVNGKVWFGPQASSIPTNFGTNSYSNLTLKSVTGEGSWITLEGSYNAGGRNGIQFLGNDLNIFQSDDNSQGYFTPDETEIFSFYSKFAAPRIRNAEIRVHGASTSSFDKYLSLSYVVPTTNALGYGKLATDEGNIILMPGINYPGGNYVGINTINPLANLHVATPPGPNSIPVKVLIGDKAPYGEYATSYKLAVEGTGVFQAVAVTEQSAWADFVFEPTYKLPELKKVESYIATNGHLPEIPSEKEVKEKGYQLANMDAKLLQKIEELTLYIIDLQKQVDALKAGK